MLLNLAKQHGKNSEYALCAAQWHKTLSPIVMSFLADGMHNMIKNLHDMYGYAPPYQAAESSAALISV